MDDLRKQSDKELKKIEDEIERIYKDAEGDLREKWTAYMDRAEKRVASYGKAYSDAVKSGDADAIAAAKAALNKKIESVTIRDKQFADMVDAVTDRMANVNQLAADYVNGQMPAMYRYNYNGSLREVQKDADAAGISGIAFNMIDDATVERMQKRGEVTLPKRKIDVPKDKQWNRKAINAQIMQGIIQGESIPQMSKRLREVTDMNKNSSIRNARTLTTEAENGGRLDSMKTASDLGLEYEKTWIATHDERTRLSHALIDGESVPLDEKFSNGLQYPADPSGPPEEVYNCRCSLVRKLIGYKGHAIDNIGSYEPTYFDDVKADAAANKPSEDELHETAEAFTEEQATETAAEEERVFVPATTIQEAEEFISQYVDGKQYIRPLGVSYKGVDLEVANKCNETLSMLQETFNSEPFGGIAAPAGNTREGKLIKNAGAAAAYSPYQGSFMLNRENMATMATYEKFIAQEVYYQTDMLQNPQNYNFEKASKTLLRMYENSQESGRFTIPRTLEESIYHEYGHMLEKRVRNSPLYDEAMANMGDYAKKLSGYACEDRHEYIAESFCSYMKGEGKCDPTMEKIFDSFKKGK